MKPTKVIFSWDGTRWHFEGDTDLPPDTRIELTIPELAPRLGGEGQAGAVLFPKGEYLYFPINPDKNESEAWALWEQHKATHRPALSSSPDKPLIPILLEEDLRFSGTDSTNLAPCRCSHSGQSFGSLNKAASAAVNQWTHRATDSVGVFKSLCFLHDGQRLRLDLKRSEIIDETPLPSREDADAGTPWLFGEEDIT